jgi:hypothetical protein
MRAGSACLWDSRTPHGNFPNASQGWRLCQYLGFHPAPHPARQPGLAQTRRDFMRIQHENGRLPAAATATKLKRNLIGLEPWAAAEQGAEHIVSALSAKQLGLWNDFPEMDQPVAAAKQATPASPGVVGSWWLLLSPPRGLLSAGSGLLSAGRALLLLVCVGGLGVLCAWLLAQ